MTVSPPTPNSWPARYEPTPDDFNTYILDAFTFLAGPPRLRAQQLATQSLPANTNNILALNSVAEDSNSGWTTSGSFLGVSGNCYTVPFDGLYGITWNPIILMPDATVSAVPFLGFTINGFSTQPWKFGVSDGSASGTQETWDWAVYHEIYLSAGDQIFPGFNHNYSSGLTSAITPNGSCLEVVWLSE